MYVWLTDQCAHWLGWQRINGRESGQERVHWPTKANADAGPGEEDHPRGGPEPPLYHHGPSRGVRTL